ncbi:MAG: hypothetical protein ACTSYX_08955, partial [Candidatus Thorarchaeota archaeon]
MRRAEPVKKMSGPDIPRDNPVFRAEIRRQVLLAMALGALIGGALLLIVPVTHQTTVTLLQEGANDVTPSIQVDTMPASPTTQVSVYSSNPLGITDDWHFFTQSSVGDDTPVSLEARNDTDGVAVSGCNVVLGLTRYQSVAVGYFDSLMLTVSFRVDGGACQLNLTTQLLEEWTSITDSRATFELMAPADSESRKYSLPVSLVNSSHGRWALLLKVQIAILLMPDSQVHIEAVEITGHATTQLYPVQLTALSGDDEKLFDSSVFHRSELWPALNVTRRETAGFAILFPRSHDDVVYLPAGHYQATGGWILYSHLIQEFGPTPFTVESSGSAVLSIRYPVVRMYLDADPDIPVYMVVTIDLEPQYSVTLYSPVPKSLYIADFGTRISVSVFSLNPRYYARTSLAIDGHHNLRLVIRFPLYHVLNFAMPAAPIGMAVVLTSVSLIVVVRRLRLRETSGLRAVLQDSRSLACVIFAMGALVPWSVHHDIGTASTVGSVILDSTIEYNIVPLLLRVVSRTRAPWTVQGIPSIEVAVPAIIGFWVPLIVMTPPVRRTLARPDRAIAIALVIPVLVSVAGLLLANLDVAAIPILLGTAVWLQATGRFRTIRRIRGRSHRTRPA